MPLSYDPFTYKRRQTHTIERCGVRLGGEELVRIAIRKQNFEKIAHKLPQMGDYQPEIVYEEAAVAEIDPRDDSAISKLNESRSEHLVTVKDGIDLPVIAAYRLLAAKLELRHPILLKDTLVPSDDPQADFSSPCSQPRPTSARSCATASATQCSCRASMRRARRCG